MNRIIIAIFCVLFSDKILTKDLHVKESFVLKERDNSISDLTFGFDDPFTKIERFARHVELVTESVIDHVMNEMKKRYPKQNNTSKLLQRLKMKLRKRINKKNRHVKTKPHVPANVTKKN